jgi:hypothetical protein
MADAVSFDINRLSAEEFAALSDWELKEALQQCAGYMAVAQAEMRENSDAFHKYMAAKDEFSRFRQLANALQTLLRLAAQ